MEVDQYVEGNILFIEKNQLKTINQETKIVEVIVGSTSRGYRDGSGSCQEAPQFSNPKAFLQYNRNTLFIVDTWNFCVRAVSRLTNSTSSVAGVCTNKSFADGPFSAAKFSYVFDVVTLPADFGSAIIVADYENRKMRKLDMKLEQVTTMTELHESPVGLTLTPDQDAVIYTHYPGGIGMLNLSTRTAQRLINEYTYGYIDGPLPASRFNLHTYSPMFLSKTVMMIADTENGAIRLVDFTNFSVTSICAKAENLLSTRSGDVSRCRLFSPYSLLPLPQQDRILVGSYSLGYVSVTGWCDVAFQYRYGCIGRL